MLPRRLVAAVSISAALALPVGASAFCGFYVSGADADLFANATMVVLMRDGTRTVLSMQNSYQGPTEDFALVIPVPVVLEEENVQTLPSDVFDRVDAMGAPRLVEYWEMDPCAPDIRYEMRTMSATGMGRGGGGMMYEEAEQAVVIEAEFSVGEYDIQVLSAQQSTALDAWLRENEYRIPEGAEPLLRPYVEGGMYFFAAKVDAERVSFADDGSAILSPLRFYYDSEDFALPIRLGLINAEDEQDLIVNILARNQRYEVANHENVTIPTNLEVAPDVVDAFGPFYRALFSATVEANPGAVVTEYAWNASTCDPCPGATLTPADFMTLGADVIGGGEARRGYDNSFVLTRLHARYSRDTVGEDLVFAAAPPIAGGREHLVEDGRLEERASPSPSNNFQGRYIIRHPWEGEVACDNPQYGRWGGPPGFGDNPRASSAEDVVFASGGAEVTLDDTLRQSVPEIGFTYEAQDGSGGAAPEDGEGGTDDEAGETGAIEPQDEGTGETASAAPPMQQESESGGSGFFGCATAPAAPGFGLAGAVLVGLAASARRRG